MDTIERIITAAPLTDKEADALLVTSASMEKVSKVRGGIRNPVAVPTARAWTRGGRVD